MNEIQFFSAWFDDYVKEALDKSERRLVVLSGSDFWAMSLLMSIEPVSLFLEQNQPQKLSSSANTSRTLGLIYGDNPNVRSNVPLKRFRDFLGSESDFIIFANSYFNADAFAALSGTLKAGGILFLLMDEPSNFVGSSLFLQRFISFVADMPEHTLISEPFERSQVSSFFKENKINSIKQTSPINFEIPKNKKLPLGCITTDQYSAVQAIEKVVSGRRKRPLVLTADRGRGKSSALAIACAHQLKKNAINDFNVLITAPDIQSVSVFYRQLASSLNEEINSDVANYVQRQGSKVSYGKAQVNFIAIDQLIKQPEKCHLLMVDEAAAIPVYLLEKLLCLYHRLVFSSTVHGYEGAGRGFTLKFKNTLDLVCPNWASMHMYQPIRWREKDPLEKLVFDTCLLDTDLAELKEFPRVCLENNRVKNTPVLSKLFCTVIKAKNLVTNEPLLECIFAILVTAHYQTKPSDLQLLLDNERVQVACLFSDKQQNELVAVALLMSEGDSNGISSKDVMEIKSSKRRLRNHFLPQSLLTHSGFESAFNYQYLRVMRIAVHPQIQHQGVGSYFINKIEALAKKQHVDFIGASFGANSELLSFWLKAGFSVSRIGFTKDKASGEHSALVLKGVNKKVIAVQQNLSRNFHRMLDYLLLDEYKDLSPELIYLLLNKQVNTDLLTLNEFDHANIKAYSQGERLYSSCVHSLYLWFKHELLLNKSSKASHMEKVLIARLLQKKCLDTVCNKFGYTGKKQLNQAIKNFVMLKLKR